MDPDQPEVSGSAPGLQSKSGGEAEIIRLLRVPASEVDEALWIEGRLPAGLEGTLYRVGPAVTGRPGTAYGHALDGDGLVQRFAFSAGRIDFRSRVVRTTKFVSEEAANATLFPTWSRRAPGWWPNVGSRRIKSQASVTIMHDGSNLLARDEVGLPWVLDAETLTTRGEFPEGPREGAATRSGSLNPKAHVKIDPADGSRITVGCSYGVKTKLHVMRHDAEGRMVSHRVVEVPVQTYFHDFFACAGKVIVPLPPLVFHPIRFVSGLASFSDCLTWQPERGMIWLVLNIGDDTPATILHGPALWMWHGINAFQENGTIVADWIGYGEPDHFVGENAALRAIAQSRPGDARHPGRMMRTTLDLSRGTLDQRVLFDGNFEFPTLEPEHMGGAYDHCYTTVGGATILADGIARIDLRGGRCEQFHFGSDIYVGEPLPAGPDWLLVPGLDASRGQSFLAIFDKQAIEGGPVAMAWHAGIMPATFHGAWHVER